MGMAGVTAGLFFCPENAKNLSFVDKFGLIFYYMLMENKRRWPFVLVTLLFFSAVIFGALLGKGLAVTINTKNTENFTDFETALPTKLLDINGELITEFSSDEKREIIAIDKLPQHMIDALVTREDRIFYIHHGFSTKAIIRAVIGVVTGKALGGASTLSQQIAGTLYCDRKEMSIKRKLKELWWAIQMERRWSKNEILEQYLNKIYFGGGTYGVNAACKYYFGHAATDITPAEAAILVIQLSNPTLYNPFDNPNLAMDRQQYVLSSMVSEEYLTKEDAEESFNNFWANFDYTRTSSSAYMMREDKAPWFSEYVRRELSDKLYGTEDIYTGGFTVNTTVNLAHQQAAEKIMSTYIKAANLLYQRDINKHHSQEFSKYITLSEMMSIVFNIPSIKVSEQRNESMSLKEFTETINPVIDVMSLMFGIDTLKSSIVNKGNVLIKQKAEKTTIEGTMVALENETGYIDALVGGSKYDSENQFIRAVQSKLQPGSCFKPLYYSAAIDSRQFTMTTVISDTPTVFQNADGTPYYIENFKGEYVGDVQVWNALAHSMNIPSIKVLSGIGFEAAIDRASKLLGIPESQFNERHLLPGYTIGLGTASVRPIELCRAFSIFANGGKEVTPMAIRSVEDRNGNVVLNPEKEIRLEQQAKGDAIQVISPQTAFIMDKMLTKTVESGTLAYGAGFASTYYLTGEKHTPFNESKFKYTDKNGKSFTMPAAGKTGTTQNWADAWTTGFTPYYTASFWFGFDKPGQSLGLSITGSTLAGVAWGDFMHVANDGLPYKDFPQVSEGIIKANVCSESGGILTQDCGNHIIEAYYLAGTEPTSVCEKHSGSSSSFNIYTRLQENHIKSGYYYNSRTEFTPLAVPDLSFLNSNLKTSEMIYDDNMEDDIQSAIVTHSIEEFNGNWLLD